LRDTFAIWYPRTLDERVRATTEGLVAVDTNVLLHLYRLAPEARKDLIGLLERLGPRLWIPH
jgi:hypothetical protein